MEGLVQPVLNGILLGGLYALIAIGMSMMFGIVKLVNLAHGDLLILSSYIGLVLMSWLGLHPFWAIVLAIPIMFLIGYIVQGFLINRVLSKGMEPPLLVAFGISIILQNFLLMIFTPDARSLSTGLATMSIPVTEDINISVLYLINFCVAMAVIFILYLFFQKSYTGRAIRAASDHEVAAQLMGVNTKRTYGFAMGIAMMTAAVAGILIGMTFTFYPHTGPQYLIISFGVVVIGGLGSIKGTFVGGFILAMAQLLGAHFLGPGFQLLSGYIVLLIVLAIRPQGIFGSI
jgi:branched-chain amino acid transport system permease protein